MNMLSDQRDVWSKECLTQLKEQNQSTYAFEEMISLYNSMLQKEKKLYYSNVTMEEQNNSLRKKISDIEESLQTGPNDGVDTIQLRKEYKEGLEKAAVLAETMVARSEKLKELEQEQARLKNELEVASKLVEEKDKKYQDYTEKREESDVVFNTLHEALLQSQIKLVKVEEKMRDDRKENKQIKLKYQHKMDDNNKTLQSVVTESFSASGILNSILTNFDASGSSKILTAPIISETPNEGINVPCKPRENIQVIPGEINSVCFSKSGNQLILGGEDKIVRIYDTTPCKLKIQLSGAERNIMCVDYSSNEEFVLAASLDNSVRVFSVKLGRMKYNLMGHLGRVFTAKFSEDSKQILSGSYDRTIRIWDTSRGFCNKTIWCITNCNDLLIQGQQIISAHADKVLRFWDTASGKSTHEAIDYHNQQISGLALSSDGYSLLSASNDHTLKIMDIRTYKNVSTFQHENYQNNLANMRCCYSPNGQYIAAGSGDGSIFIWDVNNSKEVVKRFAKRVHKSPVLCVSWTGGIKNTPNILASCDKGGILALWS